MSMRLIAVWSTAVAIAATAVEEHRMPHQVREEEPYQSPATNPLPNAPTSHGCFTSRGELEDPGGYSAFNASSGFCNDHVCNLQTATVFAMKGSTCYCGFKYPPKDAIVDDSNCNYPCPSYPLEACGGLDAGTDEGTGDDITKGFYSVFNSGVELDVPYSENMTTTSSDSATSSSPTADSTETATQSSEPQKSTNVAGIVAGVVVGVLGLSGIIGGVIFYRKRKRNKEIEEEHRRNAAVNSFVGHKPSSSGGISSITDARLDPHMAQRRLSDGSIADNQDYSRKILRVTNA